MPVGTPSQSSTEVGETWGGGGDEHEAEPEREGCQRAEFERACTESWRIPSRGRLTIELLTAAGSMREKGTHQAQINLFMPTKKNQFESSNQYSKDIGDWVILESKPSLGLDNHTFANPSSHPLRLSPWMLIR